MMVLGARCVNEIHKDGASVPCPFSYRAGRAFGILLFGRAGSTAYTWQQPDGIRLLEEMLSILQYKIPLQYVMILPIFFLREKM